MFIRICIFQIRWRFKFIPRVCKKIFDFFLGTTLIVVLLVRLCVSHTSERRSRCLVLCLRLVQQMYKLIWFAVTLRILIMSTSGCDQGSLL